MSEGTYQPDSLLDGENAANSPAGQQKTAASNLTGYMSGDDLRLIELLRSGNETAFVSLIEQYHSSMLRLAKAFIPVQAVAEEIVQETWMAVLQGIQRFEGRSSLKTWIFRILVNRAKTRGVREGRTIPMSALENPDLEGAEPAVNADRFLAADHPQWPGHWASAPQSWETNPEASALAHETRACIEAAIAALPPSQQTIITLRDVEGWSAEEVCESLGLTDANQRV